MNEDLKYPIGKYIAQPFSEKLLGEWLTDIKNLPQHLENAVLNLDEAQFNTQYRDEGWTLQQVVHHVADSHINAYVRMKLAVTENAPAIKAYDEARWAELAEAKTGPVEMSLALLEALHRRWVMFLRSLPDTDFSKVYLHPELGRVTIDEAVALYAWHCRHHEGHIRLGLGN